jgi:hypothetical protein
MESVRVASSAPRPRVTPERAPWRAAPPSVAPTPLAYARPEVRGAGLASAAWIVIASLPWLVPLLSRG